MNAMNVSIPAFLYERLAKMAEEEQTTVDQIVASAVAEKIAVVGKEGYISQRAKRADEQKYREALSAIPDCEPAPHDEL